jgi:hypothetical protein
VRCTSKTVYSQCTETRVAASGIAGRNCARPTVSSWPPLLPLPIWRYSVSRSSVSSIPLAQVDAWVKMRWSGSQFVCVHL